MRYISSYKLFENKAAINKLLDTAEREGNKIHSDTIQKLRELTKKTPNNLYTLLKWLYQGDPFADISHSYNLYLEYRNKNLKVPNISELKDSEELYDKLQLLDRQYKINTVVQELPSNLKKLYKQETDKTRIDDLFFEFSKTENKSELLNKVSRYKNLDELINVIENFINPEGKTYINLLYSLEAHNGASIIYKENNIIIAIINSYSASSKFGSSSWCISTMEHYFNSYTKNRTQYFIWDFNLDSSDNLFQIGATKEVISMATLINNIDISNLNLIYAAHDKYDKSVKNKFNTILADKKIPPNTIQTTIDNFDKYIIKHIDNFVKVYDRVLFIVQLYHSDFKTLLKESTLDKINIIKELDKLSANEVFKIIYSDLRRFTNEDSIIVKYLINEINNKPEEYADGFVNDILNINRLSLHTKVKNIDTLLSIYKENETLSENIDVNIKILKQRVQNNIYNHESLKAYLLQLNDEELDNLIVNNFEEYALNVPVSEVLLHHTEKYIKTACRQLSDPKYYLKNQAKIRDEIIKIVKTKNIDEQYDLLERNWVGNRYITYKQKLYEKLLKNYNKLSNPIEKLHMMGIADFKKSTYFLNKIEIVHNDIFSNYISKIVPRIKNYTKDDKKVIIDNVLKFYKKIIKIDTTDYNDLAKKLIGPYGAVIESFGSRILEIFDISNISIKLQIINNGVNSYNTRTEKTACKLFFKILKENHSLDNIRAILTINIHDVLKKANKKDILDNKDNIIDFYSKHTKLNYKIAILLGDEDLISQYVRIPDISQEDLNKFSFTANERFLKRIKDILDSKTLNPRLEMDLLNSFLRFPLDKDNPRRRDNFNFIIQRIFENNKYHTLDFIIPDFNISQDFISNATNDIIRRYKNHSSIYVQKIKTFKKNMSKYIRA